MRNNMRHTETAIRKHDREYSHTLPTRRMTQDEINEAKRRLGRLGFMSWDLYDRMDSAQQYGIRKKLEEGDL